MALRGRRINKLVELWCLVASGGLDILVSSTSFQKSNIKWPQQPLTEQVLKFTKITHCVPLRAIYFSTFQYETPPVLFNNFLFIYFRVCFCKNGKTCGSGIAGCGKSGVCKVDKQAKCTKKQFGLYCPK